jgi:putative methionine-R-sulfoxide reductase with GAF domain
MNLSIRMKIVLITLVILFLAIGANALLSSYVFTREYSTALQSEMLVVGQGLALQLDRLLGFDIPLEEVVGFEKQCQEIVEKYEEVSYAMVVDTNGKILFHNDPAQHGQILTDPAMLKAVNDTENTTQVYFQQGEKYYDITIPVFGISGEHIAAVKIGFPERIVSEKTQRLLAYAGVVGVVSLGLAAALLVVTLSAWVTNPIMKLLVAVKEMREKGTVDLIGRVGIGSKDEIGVLAQAFSSVTVELHEALAGLEQRGRALETSAQVSRRLSTILDQQQLVSEVVEQVQKAFGYYHAHIYLVDETSGDLAMAGGTGEAGQAMLTAGHRIPQGSGLVGRAAGANVAVLVPDVSQEEDWLPNPLLPDTQSEIAVPIAVGGRVLGVLDVQHNVPDGLGQDDAELLESIAGQVAVALQNIRLFAEMRQKAEREARANLIVQRIQSATTVESALQIAIRELGQTLGAPETLVRLGTAAQPGNGGSKRAPVEHDEAETGS